MYATIHDVVGRRPSHVLRALRVFVDSHSIIGEIVESWYVGK